MYINKSGTRKEDLLIDDEELQKIWVLRKVLHPMDEIAAIEFLLNKMQDSKTNMRCWYLNATLVLSRGGYELR